MARCPACRHQVSVLFGSIGPATFLQNMFRSPASRVFTCRHCGEQLTMANAGFLLCQVAFVVIVIPCAIAFARLQTWLLDFSPAFHQFSTDFPNMAVVLLWILPTLIVTLFLWAQLTGLFVEFRKAA